MQLFVYAASLLTLLASAIAYSPPNDPPWFITFADTNCNGKVLRQRFEAPWGACVNTAARPHSIHYNFPNPQGNCYVRFHMQADCKDAGNEWEIKIPAGEDQTQMGCLISVGRSRPITWGSYRWFCT